MKVLGTGLTGLVGSRIVELLGNKYEFENISRSFGADITDKNQVLEKIKPSEASTVLHLAAKTDVDGCEKDKEQDLKILGLKDLKRQQEEFRDRKTAWGVNVLGTKNVADACSQTNKKLIYISTDFVFDGTNPPAGGYTEDDIPNPINWYAQTKYEGEKIVQNLKTPWAIIRTAYPYRASFTKPDFVRAILGRLRGGLAISAIVDHIFTPTFIDDIAFAIGAIINSSSQGIFHVVGDQSLSPYESANLIAREFGFISSNIVKTTRVEFFKDRASRPFQLALKNDKIEKLGIKMRTFEEGLREIKNQL